jgi:hypothetical protein
VLMGQEILIFQEGSTALDDSEMLDKDTTYYAFEKFGIVPVDLYRTVKLSHIHPAVRSLIPTAFTQVSPLFCAALTMKEAVNPPFYTDLGRVSVRGASLTCCDRTEASTTMPWDDVTAEEKKGEHLVCLDNFRGSYTLPVAEDSFGILKTSRCYKPVSNDAIALFNSKEYKGATKKGNIRRDCYWRFRLPSKCAEIIIKCEQTVCVGRSFLDLSTGKAGAHD